jgi:membrane protein implicated in regulation of membrane protease activity
MLIYLSDISPWIWVGVLIVCCIIEAFTLGLTTIWAAIAAVPLIFISRTGLPFQWQFLIFVVLTLLLVVFTRPFAVKKLKIGEEKTNVDSMVGEEVLVTKTISNFTKGEARAKNGVIWSAASETQDVEIPEGTVCTITAVKGNTIFINKKGE